MGNSKAGRPKQVLRKSTERTAVVLQAAEPLTLGLGLSGQQSRGKGYAPSSTRVVDAAEAAHAQTCTCVTIPLVVLRIAACSIIQQNHDWSPRAHGLRQPVRMRGAKTMAA